jgi:hypothetical protein
MACISYLKMFDTILNKQVAMGSISAHLVYFNKMKFNCLIRANFF